MDYRRMNESELSSLRFEALRRENLNAVREIDDHITYYNKRVKVVKGRKVPLGIEGVCFWLRRYDYSKYGDPYGVRSNTRVGIKTDDGDVYFTSVDNVEIA